MYAGTAAAAAAGTSGAGGLWLFSYNKENFGFDAGMRFGRFTMSRTFMNAQVTQYREDLHGMTETTVSKMDAWQTICTCFMQVCAALSCAGRIGMHGAAPPGWFCALFSGSIFMSNLFFGVSLWLSMHASLRAAAGCTSLLTRKVRLPIPSMAQLDQARVFGSAYEKQEWQDIFRVPFMSHSQEAPDLPTKEALDARAAEKKEKKKKATPQDVHDPAAEFASTARDTVPSWIRDEVVVDKGGGFVAEGDEEPLIEEHAQPDHFRHFMKAQEEWRNYDVYARIAMLYGVVSFMYAVCYYGVGTAISELRGFWVMWSLPVVFISSQALILRLDILRTGKHWMPNTEFIGHAAPFVACAACTIEYRFYYSEAQVAITWVLAALAFFCHFVMACRMYDLARPLIMDVEMPEEPGRQWWPQSWAVPHAFTKNLWFITPPKKLEDGQHCLLHEAQDMAKHGGGIYATGTCRKRKSKGGKGLKEDAYSPTAGSSPSASPTRSARTVTATDETDPETEERNNRPWQMMQIALIAVIFQWFFMIFATGFEAIMGPESLMKPPGEPPWIRDTKYRHYSPALIHLSTSHELPEDYRLFSASTFREPDVASHGSAPHHTPQHHDGDGHAKTNETENGHHDEGHHRRLTGLTGKQAAMQELLRLAPKLGMLADRIGNDMEAPTDVNVVPTPAFLASGGPQARHVEWPMLFEPRHLACGPRGHAAAAGKVLALSPRGFGALVPEGQERVEAEPFALDFGGEPQAPIAGATWHDQGLHLVTKDAKLMHCPGHTPADGAWACRPSEHAPVPVPEGTELLAAAFKAADAHSPEPLMAMVFKNLPHAAVVYQAAADGWKPLTEVHVPVAPGDGMHLGFDNDSLLVSTGSGEVHRRGLRSSTPPAFFPAPADQGLRRYHAACAQHDGGLMRLAHRRADGEAGAPWRPELIPYV